MPRVDGSLGRWLGTPEPGPGPPAHYRPEATTVWSFRDRGAWAGHRGDYPGNWSPYVPRNLILRYTGPSETVLDPMMGSATTLVEAALLGRRAVGFDLHPEVVAAARARLAAARLEAILGVGDARRLPTIGDASIDLLAMHPPYASIIRYGASARPGDLSRMRGYAGFLDGLGACALEALRVLKPGRHCAVMLGDTRKHLHAVPLAYLGMLEFLRAGFVLREDIVKLQWNMRGTLARWRGATPFYRIAHEHVFVFRKPLDAPDARRHRWSSWKGPWARCRE